MKIALQKFVFGIVTQNCEVVLSVASSLNVSKTNLLFSFLRAEDIIFSLIRFEWSSKVVKK
jgi:hypothetical protein